MEQFVNVLVLALLSMSQPAPVNATIQIEHWPALRVTEHLVDAMPAGCSTEKTGCTLVNFTERTCDIYVSSREPQKALVRERELKRCRGQDEPPFRLKAAYTQWLASLPCRASTNADGRAMVASATAN